jgi:hypothetical protein
MSETKIKSIDFNKIIPEATAAVYKIKDLEKRQSTKIMFPKFGTVDFTKLSIPRAAQLVSLKAPFIEKKVKNEVPASTSK